MCRTVGLATAGDEEVHVRQIYKAGAWGLPAVESGAEGPEWGNTAQTHNYCSGYLGLKLKLGLVYIDRVNCIFSDSKRPRSLPRIAWCLRFGRQTFLFIINWNTVKNTKYWRRTSGVKYFRTESAKMSSVKTSSLIMVSQETSSVFCNKLTLRYCWWSFEPMLTRNDIPRSSAQFASC